MTLSEIIATGERFRTDKEKAFKQDILKAKECIKVLYNGGNISKQDLKQVAETFHELDKQYEFFRLREFAFVTAVMHYKSIGVITEKEQNFMLNYIGNNLNDLKQRIEINYQK